METETKYQKLEVIWDHDHGSANEGWYLRTRDTDGQEEDIRIGQLDDLGRDASDSELRSAAIEFLCDDVSDEQDAALHCAIEVRR